MFSVLLCTKVEQLQVYFPVLLKKMSLIFSYIHYSKLVWDIGVWVHGYAIKSNVLFFGDYK